MANPQNEAVVRQVTDLLTQPQLPSDFDQLIDPDWDNHAPGGLRARGHEGFKMIHKFSQEGFSNYHVTVERLISDGDFVAVHYRMRGTHTGEFMGIPPTGRPFDVPGMTIHRFQNGKLAESWVMPDRLELFQQLGVRQIPEMPQQRAA